LQSLFDALLVDGCYFLRKNMPEIVKTVDNNMTQSAMRLLDCYFNDYIETEIKKVTPEMIEKLQGMIKPLFCFAFIWSIGATTTQVGRERFNKWMREQMEDLKVEFPEEKTVYDWHWNTNDQIWESWFETIKQEPIDIKVSYNEIVVPTVDSIRMKFVLQTLIKSKKHVLMPGPTGVGKSVYIKNLITYEMPEEYQTLTMSFSA